MPQVDINQYGHEAIKRMSWDDAAQIVLLLFTRNLDALAQAQEFAQAGNDIAAEASRQQIKSFERVADAIAIIATNSRKPLQGASGITLSMMGSGIPNSDGSVIVGEAAMEKLRRGEPLNEEDAKQIVLVTQQSNDDTG